MTAAGRGHGKTLLGTSLTRHLTEQGYHVAAIKHIHQPHVDYRVKDTGRYLEAGASPVIAVSPEEYMVVVRRAIGLEYALDLALSHGVQVIVVEGFRELADYVRALGGCIVYIEADRGISRS
nr:molybdopterin-guanine dinucleotide biosynthesis protein MobB [Hyperthermus butylicus]